MKTKIVLMKQFKSKFYNYINVFKYIYYFTCYI